MNKSDNCLAKKIMPHLTFLLPENKKDCKIKRIPRHYVSELTQNE